MTGRRAPRLPWWARLLLYPVVKTSDEARAERSKWTWARRLHHGYDVCVLSPLGILNSLLRFAGVHRQVVIHTPHRGDPTRLRVERRL